MYSNNHKLGKLGEEMAKKYFIKNNYNILAENYRIYSGEIDLIVNKNNFIIFVEVKTRTSIRFGYPQSAVNIKKINKIRKTAIHFLTNKCNKKFGDYKKRFDVIAIFINRKKGKLKHLQNVF